MYVFISIIYYVNQFQNFLEHETLSFPYYLYLLSLFFPVVRIKDSNGVLDSINNGSRPESSDNLIGPKLSEKIAVKGHLSVLLVIEHIGGAFNFTHGSQGRLLCVCTVPTVIPHENIVFLIF